MKNKVLLIIAAVVLVAALGIGGAVYWSSSNNYVATVGGEKITKAEYNFFLGSIKNEMEQTVTTSGGDTNAFWNSKIDGVDAKEKAKTRALEEAQSYKIQQIKAKENNVKLEKTEVDSINKSIDDSVKSMGRAEAEKQLKQLYGITVNEYKTIARDLTLVQKYMSQEQQKIEPTEDDYKKAYESAESADKVTVRHILISTMGEDKKPLPEDKQAEAKKKADEVFEKVKAGGDMKELAKQYSEDPGSKEKSGQYTLGRGEMVKEFEDWSFSAKPGDTGIVKTEYGYHVMKKPKYDELKESLKGEIVYAKYTAIVDEYKKDAKYNVVKNQKVYDSIVVI